MPPSMHAPVNNEVDTCRRIFHRFIVFLVLEERKHAERERMISQIQNSGGRVLEEFHASEVRTDQLNIAPHR